MLRLSKKFETARKLVPGPIVEGTGNEKIGIIAFGSSHWAVIESRDQLSRESGIETDYLRIRAFPFAHEIHDFIASHDRLYVIDQNRDSQMFNLLKMDIDPALVTKLHSIRHFDGMPLEARTLTSAIVAQEGAGK